MSNDWKLSAVAASGTVPSDSPAGACCRSLFDSGKLKCIKSKVNLIKATRDVNAEDFFPPTQGSFYVLVQNNTTSDKRKEIKSGKRTSSITY